MPVYLIGSFPTDRVHNSVEGFAQVDHYSVPLDTVAPLNKHIYYYLRDWLNLPIEEPAEADLMAMAERPEFAAMPRYPGRRQRPDHRRLPGREGAGGIHPKIRL